MTATPMRLEDALRFNGYTIDQTDVDAFDVTVPEGVIHVPAMRLSSLTWRLGGSRYAEPRDSFYLRDLPVFADDYRPVILSHILDKFSTLRIGYNTPDQFGLAVRRWGNLNLGPESILNRRYRSTALTLPLDTQDANTDKTSTVHGRDAASDFPQGMLAGDTDYASFATDRAAETVDAEHYTGRLNTSVMTLLAEQRGAYLNVDAELLDAMSVLFLRVFDRSELDVYNTPPISAVGFLPARW